MRKMHKRLKEFAVTTTVGALLLVASCIFFHPASSFADQPDQLTLDVPGELNFVIDGNGEITAPNDYRITNKSQSAKLVVNVMVSMSSDCAAVKAAIKDTSGVSDWFSIENNAVTNHKDRVSLNPGESIAVAWSIENVDQSIIDVAKNTGKVTLATIDFTYSEDKPINSDNKLNNDHDKKTPFAVIFETNDAQGNSVQTAKLYNREQLPVVGQEYDNSGKVLEVITNIENNPGIFSCKQIQSVEVVDDGIQPQTTMSWFQCCYKLASADLSKLDTSKVTNMQSMFNLCSGLTSLDLSSWDASNVTTMQAMFAGCNQLSKLDLPSGWNTSSATFMGQMFSNCASLKTLDCSGWNTSNVTDMNSMFFGCTSLASLKLTGWNTSGVVNMQDMFGNCEALASLDLLNLNTNKVQNAARMFSGCTGLEDITLGSGWNLEPHKCGLGTLYVLNEGKYSEYNGAFPPSDGNTKFFTEQGKSKVSRSVTSELSAFAENGVDERNAAVQASKDDVIEHSDVKDPAVSNSMKSEDSKAENSKGNIAENTSGDQPVSKTE